MNNRNANCTRCGREVQPEYFCPDCDVPQSQPSPKGEIEYLAEVVHKAYCRNYLVRKGEPYWTGGDYNLLDEVTKNIDRETVKAVLQALSQSSAKSEVENRIKQLEQTIEDTMIELTDANYKIAELESSAKEFDESDKPQTNEIVFYQKAIDVQSKRIKALKEHIGDLQSQVARPSDFLHPYSVDDMWEAHTLMSMSKLDFIEWLKQYKRQ